MVFPELLYGLDLLAVFVFASSGALMGLKKQWDIITIVFVSMVTALLGLSLREVLFGQFPIGFIEDIRYILLPIIAAGIILLFRSQIYRFGRFIKLTDALGVGLLFSTTMTVGLNEHVGFLQSIVLGSLVAYSGSILRDILGGEVPLILRKELYTVLCLLAGLFYFVLYLFPLEREYIVVFTALFIFFLRIIALHQKWSLPR